MTASPTNPLALITELTHRCPLHCVYCSNPTELNARSEELPTEIWSRVFQEAGKLKSNAACRTPCLDGGTVITEADIQAGLKMYNVTLREGDAVFLHTGWGDLFRQFPAQNANYNKNATYNRNNYNRNVNRGNAGGWGAQAVDLSPAQGAIIEFSPQEDGMYPFVTHAFNFVTRGAIGIFMAGDGDPLN